MSRYDMSKYSENGIMTEPKSEGFRIKPGTCLVLVFLAMVVAVGVGLIVHFAENRTLECSYPNPVVTNGGGNNGQQLGQSPAANNPTTKLNEAPTSKKTSTVAQTTNKPIATATPVTLPSTIAPPIHNIRLPGTFTPSHYKLKLKPNMYDEDPTTFTFEGSVEILMKNVEQSRNVTLNIKSLNITEGTVRFRSTTGTDNSPSFVSLSTDPEREFLIVHLDRETTPGQEYSLSMEFEGPLKDDLGGLYYSSYRRGNQTVYIATTQFEVLDARKAFPCFDEPAMKATFQVTLVRKRNLMSLSNMPIASQQQIGDDYVEDVYKTTKKMSPYLLAFIVGEFGHTEMTVPNTNITYGAWARPEMVDQTTYALQVGARTTATYIDFFEIPFPLPKQDMIALPDFRAGAMENWGLITYRESYMLYEDGVASDSQRQDIAHVIAHELAHQWFGNLVTLEWWDDVWLNEGFASFVEYIGVDTLYPEWKIFDQFVVLTLQDVFELDSYVTSHPLSSPVVVKSDIYFDHIAYFKGASLIRMVRFMLGEGTFKRGLHRYLKAHEYANANHNDLWTALSQQCAVEHKPLNITAIMEPWTLQMNYPVVTVVKDDGKLTVSQKRFLKNQTAVNTDNHLTSFGYQWKIPFTFVTESSPDFDINDKNISWVSNRRQEILAPPLKKTDWVIGNVHQYGFYRVNYEDNNWLALIRQLKTNHKVIPATNRAQIINDAWSLARSGLLSTRLALQTLEYLDKELDYVPWVAASRQITYLDNMLRQTELYGQFQAFIASKLRAPFKHFGMSVQNTTHLESITRGLIAEMSCHFRMPECLQESKILFDKWMSKPDVNPIDPNVRGAVYCSAIAEGDDTRWEFAFQQYQKTQAATEQNRLMTSLACTESPWLISRYLKLSITPSVVRKQNAVRVITSIAKKTSIGQLLAWDFIREKWNYLFNDYGKDAIDFSGLITETTTPFSTNLHLEQLKSFKAEHTDLGRSTGSVSRAIEEVKTNIHWVSNNQDIISDWLVTVASTQPKSHLTDVRLPRHLLPTLYDVTLKPMIYSNEPDTFTFEGHVKIFMTAFAPGKNVTLHVNKLDIEDSSVIFKEQQGNNGPVYIVGSMEADIARQFKIFHLDKDIEQGKNYTIEMNFTAKLKNDLAGMFYSEYSRENNTVYIVASHFEPTDARKTFPCFDEPQMKAEFDVTMIRKQHMISLSNMPIKQEVPSGDDFIIDVYERSSKMSTYLLVFIVCDFDYKEEKTIRNTTVRVWARPDSINQTSVALDAGVKILSHYEDYFGIPFPLPKQGMIAFPDYPSGATEHWGLITYRETSMLYQPGVSSANNKQRVHAVIAHELAHQWFGNLVTMDWWDDLWLNEGFAAFVEYMGIDFISPSFKIFDQFVKDLHVVFDVDSLVTSHPIFVPVQNPDEIHAIFDSISYNKGASVLRMLRFFLGEGTFQRGIQTYLKANAYNSAGHDDLWKGLQTQTDSEGKNVNVRSVMDTWIKQMNYPVVMVTTSANGKLQISQSRFLSNDEVEDPGKYVSPFNYKWKIPFTYTMEMSPKFNQTDRDVVWLDKDSFELNEIYPTNNWVIGNIQQFGVYRVNYDDNNWRLLVNQLLKDHTVIHAINRAQIINDAFGLTKANQLSMKIALSTLDYLDKEEEYIPWYAAGNELDYIENMVADTEAYGDFQRFLKKKVEKQLSRLGLKDNGTNHLDSLLRSTIAGFACRSGSEACITEAKTLFQQYKSRPESNSISPDLKTIVYCTVVREGGEEEWQFILEQYKAATVQAEKARLLYALACTQKIWILNKFLGMTMDTAIVRKQDAAYVFGYIAGSPVGRCVAWDFFRANFDVILQEYGSTNFAMSAIVTGITSSFNTEFSLQQLKDFQKLHPDMGAGTRAYSQSIEKTEANIRWMNNYYDSVKLAFSD